MEKIYKDKTLRRKLKLIEINFKIALINYDCNPHHKSLDFENFEDSLVQDWESSFDSSFFEV